MPHGLANDDSILFSTLYARQRSMSEGETWKYNINAIGIDQRYSGNYPILKHEDVQFLWSTCSVACITVDLDPGYHGSIEGYNLFIRIFFNFTRPREFSSKSTHIKHPRLKQSPSRTPKIRILTAFQNQPSCPYPRQACAHYEPFARI